MPSRIAAFILLLPIVAFVGLRLSPAYDHAWMSSDFHFCRRAAHCLTTFIANRQAHGVNGSAASYWSNFAQSATAVC